MTINERIKVIRKTEGLTQKAFASKLSISQQNASAYEARDVVPSSAVIASICREFRISREWLENGVGEMHANRSDDVESLIPEFLNVLKDNESLRQAFIAAIKVMTEQDWKRMNDLLAAFVRSMKTTD